MESLGFSSGQAIKFGWKIFKDHFWFLALSLIVWINLALAPLLGIAYLDANPLPNPTLQNLSFIFLIVLFIFVKLGLLLGYTRICIKYARGETAKWSDLFSRFLAAPSFLIATILYFLLIFAGFFLLVFPSYIWAMKFGLYMFYIADQGVGPIKALKLSSEHTYGAKWDLFAFLNIASAMLAIGIFTLGFGFIAVIPTLLIAIGWIYKTLNEPAATQPVQTA